MIRAAMVTPNLSLGGAERWLVDLIEHSPDELRWTGVALSGHGGADEHLVKRLQPCCPLYSTDPGVGRPKYARPFYAAGMTQIVPDLSQAIQSAARDADVIVTWGISQMGKFLDWFPGPRVLVSHTTQTERRSEITGVTHLAAVSRAADAYFDQFSNARQLPRQVIYNGVSLQRCLGLRPAQLDAHRECRRMVRHGWDLPKNAVAVGYLGRQSCEKNFLAAAKAVHRMQQSHVPGDAEFYAIYFGSGSNATELNPSLVQWCKQYIPHRHRLYLPVPDVGPVLAGLDVLVLASRREACSLTLLEAWAAGVPVVATPVGAIPELEAEHGRLVTRVSPDAGAGELAAAVVEALMTSEASCARYKAWDLVHAEFTVQQMAQNWAQYLHQVVEDSRR
jgi:glycosyltransferase involved in cell wall biosynthesis